MNIGKDAAQILTDLLGKFSGADLTDEEDSAVLRLLCALPETACIKDFIKAASPEEVERSGLPVDVSEVLAPLLVRLESNLPYAGRFASLFEFGADMGSLPLSHS